MSAKEWTEKLADEDLAFIKRFVLASGSLKALAEEYGISYPTIRLRLDRLIQKIQIFESEKIESEFEKTLRVQVIEGKMDLATFKAVMGAHQKEMENGHVAKRDDAVRGGGGVRDER
jgi:hypothetical protein